MNRSKQLRISFDQLNIDSLYLTKDLFKILKDLKSRNNISHWFSFDTAFSNITDKELSDVLSIQFLKNTDAYSNVDPSTIIDVQNKKIKIITQHFINTILIFSFLKRVNQPEYIDAFGHEFLKELYPALNVSNMRFSDLLSLYEGKNPFKSQRLFWDIYFIIVRKTELRTNTKKLGTEKLAFNFFYIFKRQFAYYRTSALLKASFNYHTTYQTILNEFNSVLNLIKYDLNKSKLYQDCITGLIIRYHEKIEVYNDTIDNSKFKTFLPFITNNDSQLYTFNNFVQKINQHQDATESEYYFRKLVHIENEFQTTNIGFWYLVAYSKNVAVVHNDKCLSNLTLTKLRDNGGHLRDYSSREYKDLPLAVLPYQTKNKRPLLIGFELEAFYTRRIRHDEKLKRQFVKNIENEFTNHTAICKYDGSIGSNGLEIVSVPMSYEYILFTNYFENLYNHIKADLYSYSSSASGFHIHLTRSFFDPIDILKMAKFLNNRIYTKLFEEIGGRAIISRDNGNTYYGLDSYDYAKDSVASLNLFWDIRDFNERARYLLLNTNPEKSIELRFFKGNIKADTILRYVQFAVSLAYYTKTVSFLHTNIKSYWQFLEHNKHEYSLLYQFIKNKFQTNEFSLDVITSCEKKQGDISTEDEATSKSLIDLKHKFTKKFRAVQFKLPKVFTAPSITKKKARRIYSITRQQRAI
jgi:hypothetical protein